MIVSLQKILFFIIVFTLPITNFIKNISSIGPLNGKLSTYFVIIGLFFWILDIIRNKKEILFPKYFKIWAFLFLIFDILVSIYGLYSVDYRILEHEKLKIFIEYTSIDTYISLQTISVIFFFIKIIKNIVFNFILTFGTSLWIYNLFFYNFQNGIKILKYAIYGVIFILFLYSIPETLYLLNVDIGKQILSTINPFLYEIGKNYNWHPPLYWKNQMRLIFPEPSNIGLFMSIILPMFTIYFFKAKTKVKYLYGTIISFYSYCIFMSQARTAYALLVCFVIFILILTLLKKENFYNFIIFCILICIGFSGYYTVMNNKLYSNEIIIEESLNNNLLSITNSNARSNGARFGVIKTEFKMGMDNIVTGVGKELTPVYFEKYLSEEDASNNEIKLWLRLMREKGIFKSSYPNLNEYTRTFAETGILGVFLFVSSFVYTINKLLFFIFKKTYKSLNEVLIISLGLLLCMISWMGSPATAFYIPFIYLGFAFIVINKSLNIKNEY